MNKIKSIRFLIAIVSIVFLLTGAISHMLVTASNPISGEKNYEKASMYDLMVSNMADAISENVKELLDIDIHDEELNNKYEMGNKYQKMKMVETLTKIVGISSILIILGAAIAGFVHKAKKKTVGVLAIIGGGLGVLYELFILLFLMPKFKDLIGALNSLFRDFLYIRTDIFAVKINTGCYVSLFLGFILAVLGLAVIVMKADTIIDVKDKIEQEIEKKKNEQADDGRHMLPKAIILGISGIYHGASFDISDGRPVKMGRDSSACQIVFDQYQSMISRIHCVITYNRDSDDYIVRDVSKNGVFINDISNRMQSDSKRTVPRGTLIYLGSDKNSFKLN